jgi:hypothetical protein
MRVRCPQRLPYHSTRGHRFDARSETFDVGGHLGAGLASHHKGYEDLADAVSVEVDGDRDSGMVMGERLDL